MSEMKDDMQVLTQEFNISCNRSGTVTTTIRPSVDPEASGQTLVYPQQSPSRLLGYPICKTTVQSTSITGYGSMYGWVQLAKSVDANHPSATGLDGLDWEMDPSPPTQDLNLPFCYHGHDPTLLDIPMRPYDTEVDWIARAFLCYMPDGFLSKVLVPAVAFEWGFWMRDSVVEIKPLKRLELSVWNEHVELMTATYKGWTFERS